MVICNNRKKCGISCGHGKYHIYDSENMYGGECSSLRCKGYNCSFMCGRPRECINEFVEMVKKSISKKNEFEV